jgi:hypothetical protein
LDDLLAYIIALFYNDADLQVACQAAGASLVNYSTSVQSYVRVVREGLRVPATYPIITVEGFERNQTRYGDTRPSKFNGDFTVAVTTRQNETLNLDAYSTLVMIKQRITDLILGNLYEIPALSGLSGQNMSTEWRCMSCFQISPTGYVRSIDPTIFKWTATYNVLLSRNSMSRIVP